MKVFLHVLLSSPCRHQAGALTHARARAGEQASRAATLSHTHTGWALFRNDHDYALLPPETSPFFFLSFFFF